MSTDLELSQQLTTVVAATPGVSTVYAAGSPIRAVLRAVADAVSHDGDDAARVSVGRGHDGVLSIGVTIGVHAGEPVPTTLRLVGDTVQDYLRAYPVTPEVATIDVQACRIELADR